MTRLPNVRAATSPDRLEASQEPMAPDTQQPLDQDRSKTWHAAPSSKASEAAPAGLGQVETQTNTTTPKSHAADGPALIQGQHAKPRGGIGQELQQKNMLRAETHSDKNPSTVGHEAHPCPDLPNLLRLRARELGDSPAYVFLGNDLEATHVLSYAGLHGSGEAIAQKLRALSRPGDRVLLSFNNDMDAVQLFWGCILAGVVPIPAPAPDAQQGRGSEARLSSIATDAGVALALTHASHIEHGMAQIPDLEWHSLPSLLAIEHEPDPFIWADGVEAMADIAYLQYTSGSTSAPRGVEITHENVLAQCHALMSGLHTHRVKGLIWLPWFHDYGLVHGLIQPLYSSGTSFLMSTAQFLLRPLRWLEAIEKHAVTHSGAPDFAYLACVKALARTPGWPTRLDSWQLASCGAEPVRATTLRAFTEAFAPCGFNSAALAPSYGLAEAVLAVTVHDAHSPLRQVALDGMALESHQIEMSATGAPGAKTFVGCGPALPGFQLRIVDPITREPCAADRMGEVWVSGSSVARGYWGQRETSAELFEASLSAEKDATRRYLRTGDLGFMHAGELFVAGRLKDMILVNGRNLYPQDLEQTAEAAHSGIRQGSAIAISVDQGHKEMPVMLLECSRRPSPATVREMIESVQKQVGIDHQLELHDVIALRTGTLPRTSSGKPMRAATLRLYVQGALEPLRLTAQAPSFRPSPQPSEPDEPLINALIQIWSDVLMHDGIEADSGFFDLGGDSLLATQLVTRVRSRLGVELPISAVFQSPTVRGLARMVVDAQGTPLRPTAAPVQSATEGENPRGPGTQVALSFSQERMWFMHELAPQGSAYNVPLAIHLHGVLDMAALTGAFERVVQRHEILRTRFLKSSETVVGEVMPPSLPLIEEVHLEQVKGLSAQELLHIQLARAASEPFRLDQCPLFRTQVIHIGANETVLLMVMHHIISDQWSFAELGRELAAHYSAIMMGEEVALPPLPIQYADYASWHRAWFEDDRRQTEMTYWRQRLEGLELLPLNTDFPQPLTQTFRGAALRLPLDPEHIDTLRRLGAAHEASLSMVLIAALNVLLLRHTGKSDIGIGVPIANRHHLASENLIGTFVNTLVFRTDLGGDPDFRTVLSRVREVSLEAFAHQDMPFELLVRELAAKPDGNRQPLFNVMFNMVNAQVRDVHFKGLTWSRLDFDRASTQFDLAFIADFLYDHALVIEYATDLFAPETVQRMGEHLRRILHAAVEEPSVRVATIPILSDAETAFLARLSLGPSENPGAQSVTQWISRGLRRSALQPAVIFGTERLTHQELDEAANRLARLMRQRGIARGTRVGVCLPRGSDLLVTLLAILKTGAAYVPLDPDYPSDRLLHQINDANLALLVTQSSVMLACEQPARLLLDVDRAFIAANSAQPLHTDPELDARPDDPAYVIYTSGSTGRPKGVAVPHRAVVNLLTSMARTPGLAETDRLLAVTTPSFDIAVLELYLPLGVGGTVVIASETQASDGRLLAELIERENITALQATPSRWHMLIDTGWCPTPARLKALVGGEPLTPSLASQLMTRCAEVWNMYGPTETTVWSSCWRVTPGAVQAIDLGRPVMNTSIQVLDALRQPCPIGVPGEIYIGGDGVALGYHDRQALTDERFIVQPNSPRRENKRIYRTGDRGRWRHDGSLEHGGRLDDQIKLRGYRVELGEIETHLLHHAAVSRAVVMLREDVPGQARLVAYVVPQGAMPSRDLLREFLSRWLPDHMVPGLFIELSDIPVLPNGKTNRRALPVPPSGSSASSAPPAEPRNNTEAAILAIWKATLQVDRLGIHDNFFDLGGHSILAVGVVGRIEAALGRPCALALLFKHPTIAGLSAALASPLPEDAADVPMAALQPQGEGPGLFLLAGAEMYRHLAKQLGPHMPVYGVFSQTEIDYLQKPEKFTASSISVETLALEYLALIRGIQAHGPYFLGGFSIGGVLAFEVAKRLKEAGEEIGLVILLDSMLPGRGFKHFVAGLNRRLRMLRNQGIGHLFHIYRVYRKQTIHRHEPGARRNQAYARVMRAHEARPCDMPALFLQAADDASTAPAYGWAALVPGLTIERVPGKHMDIMDPPNVDTLASIVRAHLTMTGSHSSRQVPAASNTMPPPSTRASIS
jgi:amino acid adenylation domain-containing protein